MNENSSLTFAFDSFTLVAALSQGSLHLFLESSQHPECIYVSHKMSLECFPQELSILFGNIYGLYECLLKIVRKNMYEKVSFVNGLLLVRVLIEDRQRDIPIRLRKMREVADRSPSVDTATQQPFLTSIPSESGASSRAERGSSSVPRYKFLTLGDSQAVKKSPPRAFNLSNSSATQPIREYPHAKPMAHGRYESHKLRTEAVLKSLNVKKSQSKSVVRSTLRLPKTKDNQLDLSNKELRPVEVKELVGFEWGKLLVLNLGYNNIGNEGVSTLTSVPWPMLKTLYICFNNISRMEWAPENINHVRTFSMSGNQIRDIPKNIVELQLLEELFMYGNRIELLPEEMLELANLRNLSIYNNKIDPARNKRILSQLKANKVHIWD